MKTIADPSHALTRGLDAIRQQYAVPSSFPDDAIAAAELAVTRPPAEHVDRTDLPFVTLDPAKSTDLDQAFVIERSGADLLLRYAIADVGWFVRDGDPVDREAWRRGTSQYLPDGKAPLYPPILSERAASLLPDGPRPAMIFAVRVANDGSVHLDGVERAIVRSRAKLAYDRVTDADLPPEFPELAERVQSAEARRGGSRVDPPQQEVTQLDSGDYALTFRARLVSEDRNAALSLAANLAVADMLFAHRTGLFRVMAPPDDRAVRRLRFTAEGLGLNWPNMGTLDQFQRTLDPADPRQASLMLAIRRAGSGASYSPYQPGITPWHAAMAATYAHATAPLRRLADRYVMEAAFAIANGLPVPGTAEQAFPRLPPVMARAEALGGQIERAVVDLAEAVMLQGSEGKLFAAVVTDADDHGARIQLRDEPVVARLPAHDVEPGQVIRIRLTAVDITRRTISFEQVATG